jgi:hypothetical protein
MKNEFQTKWNSSNNEDENRKNILNLFQNSPIPDSEKLMNLDLYMKRQDLSMLLFMHELYTQILNVHGIICEFGVRWGKNLALFQNFRGIYEPYNHNRKIVGFDTFQGFPSVDKKDGNAEIIAKGSYNVTKKYEEHLNQILNAHENESPISHIKKFELVKGDASLTINEYLNSNPQSIIALAYFDFDIYKPTYDCLASIKSRLTKGSVIGFDELNCKDYPGETLALMEIFGLNNVRVKHTKYSPTQSYFIVE